MADNQGELRVLQGFWNNDEGWAIAWPAALVFAVVFHGVAFSMGAHAPTKAVQPPVEMAIVAPPPKPPEPPPPPPEIKEPDPPPRPPEKKPKDLPPPPNETSPPPVEAPPEVQPVTGVTADSVVAENTGGPQVRVGNTTFGDPDTEKFTAPQEVQRAVAQPFDYAAYKERVFKTMDREKIYPRKARVLGLQGTCRVILLINRDGSLAEPAKLFRGTGHDALDEECLRMATVAKFPPVVGETTFPVRINQAIVFSLITP